LVADGPSIAFVRRADGADRVPVHLAIDILERCAFHLGDPLFGMKYAQKVDPKAFGPISLFWRYAPSLRYNHRCSARILDMHSEGFTVDLVVSAGEARFVQKTDVELRRAGRQFVETHLSFFLRICRWILGEGWSPLRITLMHEPSCDEERYETVLGAPIVFGASEDAVIVRETDLDRQSLEYDGELLEFIEQSLNALAERQPLQFRERLNRIIDSLLAMQNANLQTVASAMSMSPRTLQRRLHGDGASFQAALDDRRRRIIEIAKASRERPNLAQLAQSIGYSDASAVSRFLRTSNPRPYV